MADKHRDFQPGAILHQVVVGAFRMQGKTLHHWCLENGVTPASVRNSTYGQASGPVGRALLERAIDAAGREVVSDLYARRMREEAERLAS
ncbi:MAG: hypothetical protein NTX73_13365 [Rhodobacterales bacterium]|nr:hypothetical protein [Rhodobacterales bacterium]